MDLLVYLASRPGELVSKDELVESVWEGAHVSDDALVSGVAALRRALQDSPRKPRAIETVPKRGYRLIAPVSGMSVAIAVLPLDNLSRDPEQDFFADAMTDALITALGRNRSHLRVISRTSSMRFKHSTLSLPEIAAQLGVDLIVEGSVLRDGDNVRITVQLIDAHTDHHLWAQMYDRYLGDVLRLQSELAFEVDRKIRVELELTEPGESELLQPEPLPPVDPSSFLSFLKGRSELARFTEESFRLAMESFESARDKDPSSPFPYLGMSMAWGWYSDWGLVSPRESIDEMKAAAAKALELGGGLAPVHVQAGKMAYYVDRDWAGAEAAYRRALELNPNSSTALWSLSHVMATTERVEDALRLARRAVELDPMSALPRAVLGWHLLRAERTTEAIACAERAIGLDAEMAPARLTLWTALALQQRHDQALRAAANHCSLLGWKDVAKLMKSRTTYVDAMRAGAAALAERRRDRYTQPSQIARLFAQAGETTRAVEWLEVAYDEREHFLVHLGMPEWRPLRGNDAFEDLMHRVGLPTSPIAPPGDA